MTNFDNETIRTLWIFYAVERNKAHHALGQASMASDLEAEMEGLRATAERVWDEKTEIQAVHGVNPYRKEPPTRIENVLHALDELNAALQELPDPHYAVSLVLDHQMGRLREVMMVPVPAQEKK